MTGDVRIIQCPGCWTLQAVPERYDEIGEFHAHMTGNSCYSETDTNRGDRDV